jgi:pimeloyl-ACP methyl ester carboxylesterase
LADTATTEHFEAPDGTRLGVHVVGSGPPLVCVPGGPGRASAYLEDFAGLSAGRTLLRFDLRGTGSSELPADRDSLAFPRLADDIEALRLARGLETMDVVAHSAGCFVTLMYAARHPKRISRLVLVTPSGRGFGDVDEDVRAIRASRSGEPWYPEAAEIEAEIAMMPPERRQRPHRGLRVYGYSRWDERAQEHAASTDSQMSLRAMAAFAPADHDGDVSSTFAQLKNVTAPVLIVVGAVDGMTGVKAGHIIAGALPDARVVELADCGHYPWVDVPDAFRETVLRFLAEASPAAQP